MRAGTHVHWFGFALLIAAAPWGAGCRSLDPGLLTSPDAGLDAQLDGGVRGAARADADAETVVDAGQDARQAHPPGWDAGRDAGTPAMGLCRPNPDTRDEVCPEICPEGCNGRDDDCDLRIDEDASASCALSHATSLCDKGECLVVACAAGYRDCDGQAVTGCEAELATDLDHCGRCDAPCFIAQAVEACVASACVVDRCETGWGDCDGNGLDCEIKTNTLAHCGACDTACGGLPHASASCATGSCAVRACLGNFDDCNGKRTDGCETALDSLADCGGCNVACAKASCAGGVCSAAVCTGALADCDGDEASCETDLSSDVNHCGGCVSTCTFDAEVADPHGLLVCAAGDCAPVCNAGWGDCDGDYTTGCETAVNSVAQCGACGFDCAVQLVHAAVTTCNATSFQCEVVGCAAGFGDCDGSHATGCETDLYTTADCGGCSAMAANEACTGLPQVTTSTCPAGTCVIDACAGGFGDCDGMAANGCEQEFAALGPCAPDTNCEQRTYAGHDYFFCTNQGAWLASRDKCRLQLGGDLVSIDDGAENAFVKSRLAADAWIGANDRAIESRWAWSSDGVLLWQGTAGGTPLLGSYTAWSSGEPNAAAGGDDCAQMRLGDGTWMDRDCAASYDFVCERTPDECPGDAAKLVAGQCGCGNPDTDTDMDGFAVCIDGCPADGQKSAPGMCGCGAPDTDTDTDGTADCVDLCPSDSGKIAPGLCGCGTSDVNSDGDAQPDCNDLCPRDAAFVAHCPRVRITIDPTQVDATLTDFPVLVNITNDADLMDARVDGLDLFFSADGGATPLPFEIEQWTQATGTLVAWVRLASVDDAVPTVFYLRHGDGSGVNRANASDVWSGDYRAVYHMQYGGGAGTQTDSTANANHAAPDTGSCAAAAPVNQASGIIGKALTFGGDTCDRLIASDANSLDLTGTLTISAWVRPTAAIPPVNGEVVVSKRIRTTEAANYQVGLSSAHNMYFMWGYGTGNYPAILSSPAATSPNNAWSYVVWTVQGTTKALRTYLDGVRKNSSDQNLSNSGSAGGVQLALVANGHPLFIGGNDQETDEVFYGDLDEVRIQAVSRPLAWIAAEFKNQKAGSTFLDFLDE